MSNPSAQPMLSVLDLSVTFPFGGQRVPVVDRVSFSLASGEVVGLVGESGCGKTLTGTALLGLVPCPPGHAEAKQLSLAGQDLTALDEAGWRRIRGGSMSMIFQEPLTALDPVFSIGGQMTEVIKRHLGATHRHAYGAASAMLQSIGFADPQRILRSYPHELSGGMRQRAMIAMAMSCRPRVLIADEPTTALDVTTQAQILRQIRQLTRTTGTAVLLITHDLGVVAEICDRALVMYCGRIVEQGPVEDLFLRPRHPYTAGLLAALPKLSKGPVRPVKTIPGSVPLLGQQSAGCMFNDRCPHAQDVCVQQVPELTLPGGKPDSRQARQDGHWCACHHPLESSKLL